MAILVFQHDPNDRPGRLGQVLRDNGHKLRVLELFNGARVPADLDDVDGVLSLGGAMDVDQKDQYPWMAPEMALLKAAHEAELPVVGLCLGCQLVAAALGGEVGRMAQPEIGWHEVTLAFPGTMEVMCYGLPWKTTQFHAHGCEVTKLPPGGTPLMGSKACKTQAYKVGMKTYAFQYHFEWLKEDIELFLAATEKTAAAGGFGSGVDLAAARAGMAEKYPMYRHLGDRLCNNLASWLFPLDKRLGHKVTIEESVANFKGAAAL